MEERAPQVKVKIKNNAVRKDMCGTIDKPKERFHSSGLG